MHILPEDLERLRAVMNALDPAGPPRARLLRSAPAGIRKPGGHLGILDASFNPMTCAHEEMALRAARTCGFDEILLMLSRANVDKPLFGADLGQRLAVLLHYAKGRPGTSVAGCSHARFVDKVRALRPLYPLGTRFSFVLGYDTLVRLFEPRYYENMHADLQELFSAARVVAAGRGADGVPEMQRLMDRPACRPYAGQVDLIPLPDPYAAMSSSEVRRLHVQGAPIRHLVPESVAEALEALELYQPDVSPRRTR